MSKLSNLEFIEKAKNKFPQFDYSKVIYKNMLTKVTIMCPKHGEFTKRANTFIYSKWGCTLCAQEAQASILKFSEDKVLQELQNLRPEYDFTQFKYIGADKLSVVGCKEHGDFNASFTSLKSGRGCPKCGDEIVSQKIRKGREEFLKEAKAKAPQYDYSKVVYKTRKDLVEIICPIHGSFFLTPDQFLREKTKIPCQKCAKKFLIEELKKKKEISDKKRKEEFKTVVIPKFPQFDFSKFKFVDWYTEGVIICPEHGEFLCAPYFLNIKIYACRKCADREVGLRGRLSEEDFKLRVSKKFPHLDFSITEYKGAEYYIKFICPIHGVVQAHAGRTLYTSPKGCPVCAHSSLEILTRKALAELNLQFTSQQSFPDCKYKVKLRFDFYLPEQNILIECQGEGHEQEIDWAGRGKEWAHQQYILGKIRDMIKKNYCKWKKITLIEIPYTVKSIESIIEIIVKYICVQG